MTDTQTSPTIPGSSHDDGLTHIICCNEEITICGCDVKDAPIVEDDDNVCVVCLDLEQFPCERCGE